MTDQEITDELKKMLAREYGIDEETIEDDADLKDDLNLTDVELDDLVSKIEEKYDLQIPPEEASKFKKMSDIVTYLWENIDVSA